MSEAKCIYHGGPAFPGQHEIGVKYVEGVGNVYEYGHHEGMTLRDYFAAKAMLGQLSYGECLDMSAAAVAAASYELADAMLKAREA